MKKILIIQQVIEPYRVPFYNELNKSNIYDVVGFYDTNRNVEKKFQTIEGDSISFLGFKFQFGFWRALFSRKFDLVIAEFNLHLLSSFILLLYCNLFRVNFCWWGIGFGKSKVANIIRVFLVRYSDALIVYEEKAKELFVKKGISSDKVFVKNNTVHVDSPSINNVLQERNTFLVIGTLHNRKKIDLLLRSFASIRREVPESITIQIIGDGPCRSDLSNLAMELEVFDRVNFLGRISEEKELKFHFFKALAVVHPGQAGLSVLHSFAYGVPFVTSRTAISGGEIENIKHGYNGLFYDKTTNELSEILRTLAISPEYSYSLGSNALEYYLKHRTMSSMAQNYLAAADYALCMNHINKT